MVPAVTVRPFSVPLKFSVSSILLRTVVEPAVLASSFSVAPVLEALKTELSVESLLIAPTKAAVNSVSFAPVAVTE